MKKILLASTALVATAGVASAQDLGVALSGNAKMGIFDNGNDDTQFLTDLDVTFTMTGEADNGLTFGATIDLDEAADYTDEDGRGLGGDAGTFELPGRQGGENMFVSFGGATLTMGDTDGALDKSVPEMNLAGGSLTDDETTHAGFDDGSWADGIGDGQIARFDYSFNAFTVSLSAEQENNGGANEDNIYGIGFNYAGDFNGVAVVAGIGYQAQNDGGSLTSIAATATLANGFGFGATYSNLDYDASGLDNTEHFGLGVGYEMNAIALGLNYGKYTDVGGVDGDDQHGYGLAAVYDFGGGLSARLGYGYSEFDFGGGSADFDTFSLGLNMNF